MTPTPESLAEIRKRCEAAASRNGELCDVCYGTGYRYPDEIICVDGTAQLFKCDTKGCFASAAQTDIPLLLDALESAMKVIEAARKLKEHRDMGFVAIGEVDLLEAITSFDEATK